MGETQSSFLNSDTKTIEVNRGKESVTLFQRIPTSIAVPLETDIESTIYDFKHSFKRHRSTNLLGVNTADASESFKVGDTELLLMLDLKEGNILQSIELGTYITSGSNNVTLLNGQVFVADSSSKLAVWKMFNNAQQFKKPNREKLKETSIPGRHERWLQGYAGEMFFLFSGCILVSPGSMKINQLELLKTKLNEMPLFESKLDLLIDSEKGSDVELRTKTKTFHAHKDVLRPRSKVFHDNLNTNTPKTENGLLILNIEDVSDDILQEMLFFIYTDTCPEINNKARELLQASDIYAIEKLKLLAELALTKSVDYDNVCELSKLADTCNANNLLAFTVQYIIDNFHAIAEGNWAKLCDMPKKIFGDVMKAISDH